MAKALLDPNLWNLETVFKSLYNIPVYQRPYSWDKEQVNVLLKDVFDNYESDGKLEGYYTGNIIVYDKDIKVNGLIATYDIIDGQQRITTFSLLLLSLYSYLLSRGISSNDSTIMKLKECLWKPLSRECQKNLRAVIINSIEKECYDSLYDSCFDAPTLFFENVNKYECRQVFDQRIVNNINEIHEFLNLKFTNQSDDYVLDFADYLLNFIKFISIEANCRQQEVFTMFESINSKGKKLEVIDLIKTYIFSKMDEDSYNMYSVKWGNLINKTKDNLYDYLYTYIRAYVSYYRQNINVDIFKSIASRDLISIYNVNSEVDALKKLIDELEDKVDYYNMLFDVERTYLLVKSSKLRFYNKIFEKVGYQHPKPLFFRCLIEFGNNNLSKNDIEDIVIETVTFMLKFLTISDRDSKDAINVFKDIMTDIIKTKTINKNEIINKFESQLILKGITNTNLKELLNNIDCYTSKKDISIPLIALYESTEKIEKNGSVRYKISYDQAYELVNNYSKLYSLDHLLVQTPEIEDKNFKYYCNKSDNTLVLKEGNDFPTELAQTGMDYDIFTKSILNKIGNLRIYYRDKNSSRQNDGISLPENENFYDYKNIKIRGADIGNVIFDYCLPQYKIDVKNIDFGKKEKKDKLLNMVDFFEMGILSSGDKVYLTTKPDNSEAILIDPKYVFYKGNKMTINEWGCSVNGWKSIRIYEYMAKVGSNETLQSKREQYQIENDEEAEV